MARNPSVGRPADALDILAAPLRLIYQQICDTALHNQRSRKAEYLLGLSDEQLARRGLRREDVFRHVHRRRPQRA